MANNRSSATPPSPMEEPPPATPPPPRTAPTPIPTLAVPPSAPVPPIPVPVTLQSSTPHLPRPTPSPTLAAPPHPQMQPTNSMPSPIPTTQADADIIRALEELQMDVAKEKSLLLTTPFTLLMKVPDPEYGRQVTEEIATQDLKKAWTDSYHAVGEFKENYFVATFQSDRAMLFVIKKQPWLLRHHNLLLEMYDLNRDVDSYRFQYLEITVRLYGIPRIYRTNQSIQSIIQLLEQQSDFHQYTPECVQWQHLYVPVRVKRICTFCATFFQNAEDCQLRRAKLLENAEENDANTAGFEPFRPWMNQIDRIDGMLISMIQTQFRRVDELHAVQPSPLLLNLRQAFATRPKGQHESTESLKLASSFKEDPGPHRISNSQGRSSHSRHNDARPQ